MSRICAALGSGKRADQSCASNEHPIQMGSALSDRHWPGYVLSLLGLVMTGPLPPPNAAHIRVMELSA